MSSSSKQDASQTQKTSVTDQRVGVADQGVYAGSGASVVQGNDFRQFDDNSQFTVTDGRDFSSANYDYSTTNITTLDGEVARAAIDASGMTAREAINAAKNATAENSQLLERALDFGENVTGAAFNNQNAVVEQGFGLVGTVNKDSLNFATGALKTAVDAVTKSADADRAFASEFTGRIFETAKSADQANVEKLIKAATVVVGLLAAAWSLKSIFGKSSA